MPDKINIPISVTGAEAAKRQLGQVGQSVAAVGGAQQAQGAAASAAAEGTGKHADETTRLHIEGKRAAASLASDLNPELGRMALVMFHVTDLLRNGSALLFGLAGAGVGLGVIVELLKHWAEEARKAAAQQQTLNESIAAMGAARQSTARSIESTLEKFGQLSPQNAKAGLQMYQQLGLRYGIESTEVAGLATAAGIGSVEEAAILADLKGGPGGERIKTPQQAAAAIAAARASGKYQRLAEQVQEEASLPSRRQIEADFAIPGGRGALPESPEELAYNAFKKAGTLPAGVTNLDQFRALVGDSVQRAKDIKTWEALGNWSLPGFGYLARSHALDLQKEQAEGSAGRAVVEQLRGQQEGRRELGGVPTQPVIINVTNMAAGYFDKPPGDPFAAGRAEAGLEWDGTWQ